MKTSPPFPHGHAFGPSPGVKLDVHPRKLTWEPANPWKKEPPLFITVYNHAILKISYLNKLSPEFTLQGKKK